MTRFREAPARRRATILSLTLALLACWCIESLQAQPAGNRRRGELADKPLFRDPVFDGAADPVLVYNFREREWFMFYTNRRAKLPDDQIDGVSWVHGTKIGIAKSRNGAKWEYVGTAEFDTKNLGTDAKDLTFWAPDVVFGNGQYHMYVTLVPGVFRDWGHPRTIAHFTSRDLQKWEYQSTLKLASEKVIDASVVRMPEGGWRMWYNNEADKKSIYYADSEDLNTWTDRGKVALPGQNRGEGPKVFRFQDAYWLIMDTWDGLAAFRSDDALQWTRQPNNLLRQPGTGPDDGVIGQHPDVLPIRNRAYLFYFTHPGRTEAAKAAGANNHDTRRSSIQVAELKVEDDALTCDRDAPVYINLRFRRRPQIHDPSTIIKQGDRYWCFATGMGVDALYSTDLTSWHQAPSLFSEPPKWVFDVVPTQRGHFWAPDVVQHNGRYWVYYSVSDFGKRTSAIAAASSPTLDPQADGYGWQDHGIVIQTDESNNYNAIDPAITTTADGQMWMAFGSFWSGIKLIQLDPETGKRIQPDSPVYSLAHKNEIEAASIIHHDSYYYLLLDWGRCCRGVRSTYNIRVGRSREITGPYVDRDGVDMLDGGGTLVLETDGGEIGPGHPAYFHHEGQLMLSYHFYSAEQRGRAQLGIRRLNWDDDGWPQVAPSTAYVGSIVVPD